MKWNTEHTSDTMIHTLMNGLQVVVIWTYKKVRIIKKGEVIDSYSFDDKYLLEEHIAKLMKLSNENI